MKTDILYILLCFFTVAFTTVSCDDFLDITPDGQVQRDELLSTAEGIEDAMYGVYSQMRLSELYGMELHYSSLEVMSQTLSCYGAKYEDALGRYDYSDTRVKSQFESTWVSMYKNISNVNSVLSSPLVEDATEFPYRIYRGEALGLRAFMHFDLVRLFAEQYTVNSSADGIPYATEFSLNTPEFESLEKNYEHIIADLLLADSLLRDEEKYENSSDYMRDRKIHFNIYAVWATLARVYLTMGNKELAYKYADKVISGGKYILKEKTEVENDVAGVLSKKECLFGIYYPGFYTNVYQKIYLTTSFYSLSLRDDYLELYNRDAVGSDERVAAYFTVVGSGEMATVRLGKIVERYELQNNSSARPSELILGVNLIRLPEMYYIAAEALLDTDHAAALGYYNAVREHRGLEPLVMEDENDRLTIEQINDERYKEYIGEGQTFFNMKRQNLPILSYDGKTIYQPGSGIYVVPIPDVELENRY